MDEVTADEEHMLVGDYAFTLELQAAVCQLAGPNDLDTLAAEFSDAAARLRAFITAENASSTTAVSQSPSAGSQPTVNSPAPEEPCS